MENGTARINYVLQHADNALILGHRLSEWCGHGPILEQDIAITNTALDHIGRARSLFQYAASLINTLPETDRSGLFASPLIQKGGEIDEDDLAYLRDAWDFKNILLAEQPNKDWAYTVVRSFFTDCFYYLVFDALRKSSDEQLAAIAEKSLKESTYHLRWSSEWVIRLGDGTEESKSRIQEALNERWTYTGELFMPSEADQAMQAAGIAPDLEQIRTQWQQRVAEVLEEAGLQQPQAQWMQRGGKTGQHTEHLGYILAELQFLQRAYPGMEW